MKRYLNWVLAGLAAATAVLALRPKHQPETVSASSPVPAAEPVLPTHRYAEPLAIGKAVVARIREHRIPMIAGSLSYYAFLSIFPTVIAAVSIYGLVLDPADLADQIESITSVLPQSAEQLISQEMDNLVASSGSGLGLAAVLGILGALWSASAGTKALMTGIDIAYDTPEDRPFIVLRAMAIGITIGLIVFVSAAASAVTFLPELLDAVGAEDLAGYIEYGRWPAIFAVVILGLGLLYKIAPNRPASLSPWISVGALVAAVLWLLATVGFFFYTRLAPSLGAAYGAPAGVIVLLLWFFVSGLMVMLGAELNAVLEARRHGG